MRTRSFFIVDMSFEREIIEILIEAGQEGLSVQNISRHIFNSRNSFFNPVQFSDIHYEVQKYLTKSCKQPESIVTRKSKGLYCLDFKLDKTRQLVLEFTEDEKQEPEKPIVDQSLSLF